MTVSNDFLDYLKDQLADFNTVTSKRMFGGAGLYASGVMFALVADDVLYFKVGDANRQDFESRGLSPFKPFDDKPMTMSYYPVPDDVMDDTEALCDWAGKALAVALALPRPKKKKRSNKPVS